MIILRTMLVEIFAASVCIAQSVNIGGKVTDTGGTPIPGAIVRLENGGQKDTTKADGSFTLLGNAGIIMQFHASLPHMQFTLKNGLLYVNADKKSVVEIITYTLLGKTLSTLQQTMDAGIHSIALPHRGAGIYLHKVKSGSSEFVLKSNSIGGVSQGTGIAAQGSSSYALAKQAKVAAAINDVIAVTKAGYLDYRVIVTNSDTNGIQIKMIASAGTVTDADGNVYQSVRIGTQVWTVENLRTTKYNDGSAILLVTDSAPWANLTSPGYCYYNNTTQADTIIKWGALYNWYAVNTNKLAPAGWHVPADAEWDTLQNYLIASGYNWDGSITGNIIAKSMAAKTDWFTDTITGTIGDDLTKNDGSGFSALPGGGRYFNGYFVYIGVDGFWWSATELDASNAYFHCLIYGSDYLVRLYDRKSCGFSVRLVRYSN